MRRSTRIRKASAEQMRLAAVQEAVVSRKRKAVALALQKPPVYGCFELQGRRDYMEDRVLLPAAALDASAGLHLFGVYDGHGGAEASEYCRQHMSRALTSSRKALPRLPDALRQAYATVDEEFCALANKKKYESGTTAVTVVLGPKHFHIANTGDSRAVLVLKNGKGATLTIDHSPETKSEARRIKRAGGFIENDEGTLRVGGMLAVSRAIGDAYLKEFVINTPDVKRHMRSAKQAFLVLGSDGLWDDISAEDAANALSGGNAPTSAKEMKACAKKLVQMAFKAGSQDNICCLIVDLRDCSDGVENADPVVDLSGASPSLRRVRSVPKRGKR